MPVVCPLCCLPLTQHLQVFEGPWTEAFEQRVRTVVKFFKVPINGLSAAGVSAVAAAYKAEAAMQQHSSLVNAPSPDAETTEWEAWLTSSDGPYDSGNIAVKFSMMAPEAQQQQSIHASNAELYGADRLPSKPACPVLLQSVVCLLAADWDAIKSSFANPAAHTRC
jgi:hypothetical protein